ncbi:MAG TPA: hypothetical protein VKE69_07810 [Planctomycetota bacterium]|nr:hypothetical protein [Planctomycetota bacterium]
MRSRRGERGEGAAAGMAVLIASVALLAVAALVLSRLVAGPAPMPVPAGSGRPVAGLEKVYVGRSGGLGILVRSAGPGDVGRFQSAAEARALGLKPDQLVARLDAFNFSSEELTIGEDDVALRIGADELRPLETDDAEAASEAPVSPVRSALAAGSVHDPLPARTARRIGFLGSTAAFERGEHAKLRRGAAGDVDLRAGFVTERELAEFDRAPAPARLDRLVVPTQPSEEQVSRTPDAKASRPSGAKASRPSGPRAAAEPQR